MTFDSFVKDNVIPIVKYFSNDIKIYDAPGYYNIEFVFENNKRINIQLTIDKTDDNFILVYHKHLDINAFDLRRLEYDITHRNDVIIHITELINRYCNMK